MLLKPSNGQHFIYTSPIGGVGFLFSITTDVGIVLSIPIIIYQLLCFISPALRYSSKKILLKYSLTACLLAFLGLSVGYLIGLPLVLKFLSHPFSTKQITPLLAISEYLSFVSLYLFASVLICQIPVIMSFINRIKPLRPKRLFHYERHVVVSALIISAIMAPTVNIADLFIIAGPIISIYNLTIIYIWRVNAGRHYKNRFVDQDREAQTKREQAYRFASPLLKADSEVLQSVVTPQEQTSKPLRSMRPRRMVDNFIIDLSG